MSPPRRFGHGTSAPCARAFVVTVVVFAGPLVLVGAPALQAAPPADARPAAKASARFGPFDAGAVRPVARQGERGRARRPHPVVGAVGHIPGQGPPPPPLRVDPYVPEAALDAVNVVGGGLSANPLFLASLFYANFLTRMDGPRCQHLPTCSRFASQAVARHGALGIAMGLDRLIQTPSSSSLRLLPEVEWSGGVRQYDPVDNYEFWRAARFTGLPPLVPEEPLAPPSPPVPPPAAPTSPTPPESP